MECEAQIYYYYFDLINEENILNQLNNKCAVHSPVTFVLKKCKKCAYDVDEKRQRVSIRSVSKCAARK